MLHPALSDLDHQLQSLVESELEPGESVSLAVKPIPRWFVNGSMAGMIFGLLWTGMLLGGLRAAVRHELGNDDGSKTLSFWGYGFLLIFIGVGFVPLLSPVFEYRKMKRSAYVITNRRALIVRAGWRDSRIVQSFAPSRLVQLERVEGRNGTGDLIFEVVSTGSGSSSGTERRGFIGVANVRDVERVLRTTLLNGRMRDIAESTEAFTV